MTLDRPRGAAVGRPARAPSLALIVRGLGPSLAILALALPARAEIRHEPGPSAALYQAYLEHLLETDERALARAAELAKDSSFLLLEQAMDAGRRGDRSTMLELARRAVAQDGKNCEAQALLARVEFRMLEEGMTRDENVVSAMTHAGAAVSLGCADGEIHDRLAAAHAVLAARARAARDGARANEHIAAQRQVLETWSSTLRHDIAHQRLADFARETDDAALEERALGALLARRERTVLLLQRLAEIRQRIGRCEEAIPLLEEAAASSGLDAYSAISVRVNLGQCALEVGPIPIALAAFEKALELDPTNRLAALGRTEALWLLGRRDEAVAAMLASPPSARGGDAASPSGARRPDSRRELDDALTRARWLGSRRLDEALPEARRAVGLAATGTPREQAAAQALLSSLLLDRGDFTSAEAAAREGLAREPASDECLLALLAVQWAVGRKADAAREIARLEESLGPSPSWLQRVARWELAHGLDAQARAHALRSLTALEAASGPDPDAKGVVAELLLASGDPEGAERLLREALALRPHDEELAFGLADALAEQGRRDAALAALPESDAADEYRLARLAAWHALHVGPPATEEADRAIQLARAARSRVGPASHPAKLARFDAMVAGAFLAAHRPADAARSFEEALARDVLQPVERFLGATAALEQAGLLAEALALADRGARAWPDDISIDLRRAWLLLKQGRRTEALALADGVLRVAGALPGAQARVAMALADADALVDARRVMDGALERWPLHSSLWLSSGRIRERAGDIDGALRDLRRGLELDPEAPTALNAVGYLMADHGIEIEAAVRHLRLAVAARPHEAAYLDSLGWALLRAGRAEEGALEIEKAVARDRDAVIVMHLATARDRAGRREEALALYREALGSGLDEDVARVEARVKELSAPAAGTP